MNNRRKEAAVLVWKSVAVVYLALKGWNCFQWIRDLILLRQTMYVLYDLNDLRLLVVHNLIVRWVFGGLQSANRFTLLRIKTFGSGLANPFDMTRAPGTSRPLSLPNICFPETCVDAAIRTDGLICYRTDCFWFGIKLVKKPIVEPWSFISQGLQSCNLAAQVPDD